MKHSTHLSLVAGLSMLVVSGTASATAISGQGTWETTLQARDINGDGKTDAYYDTSTNLTWLADANLIKTSGYQGIAGFPETAPLSSGAIGPEVAGAWAYSLDVYGVTGWRLPTVVDRTTWTATDTHAQVTTYAIEPGTSELENLLTLTLGNSGGQLTNTGLFENVQPGTYWTGTDTADRYAQGVWKFNTSNLTHDVGPKYGYTDYAFAWAVRTGDVAAVPEPSTTGLMLLGGLMSFFVARRLARKQPS